MPDLIVIYGPPASGKAAIGSAVAEALGFRFFHNHLTANPVAALFGWITPKFGTIVDEVRDLLFERAATDPDIPGIVFTFVWAFNEPADEKFASRLAHKFSSHGGRVHFIELSASLETRIAREGTPFRRKHKPNQENLVAACERQRSFEAEYVMNCKGNFPLSYPRLVIDTDTNTESASAAKIVSFVKQSPGHTVPGRDELPSA